MNVKLGEKIKLLLCECKQKHNWFEADELMKTPQTKFFSTINQLKLVHTFNFGFDPLCNSIDWDSRTNEDTFVWALGFEL